MLIQVGSGPLTHHVYFPFVTSTSPVVKKGLALAYGHCEDVRAVGAAWVYNWGSVHCPGVENVQMAYGREKAFWPKPADPSVWIMGFNEPDRPDQANMSPDEGAVLWHDLEALYPNKKLAGPAPSHADTAWIERFRNAYIALYKHPPRLDALAAHCYGTLDFCQEIVNRHIAYADQWGIAGGVWVTEYAFRTPNAVPAPADVEQGRHITVWLEGNSRVTRYAWFTNRLQPMEFPWIGETQLCDFVTGNLTPLGVMYANTGRE